MVINLSEMKRKRRDECLSPLLDDSPKRYKRTKNSPLSVFSRTKVHAQRKFAQGSNVNSPVITPVKELERQELNVLPEPVELLPIKRPNTEDFLTFLCFRGTPILPPSLNFFNTASIVDTNGQVHEIKSESPKNGPLDTSGISKMAGSSDKPFIAFGVRKRADPIVISRQMDKKRRHALALQALRRKYQEQRMAKIRAVTISKLSEKGTGKASSSGPKQEGVKKVPKPKEVQVKIATRSMKLTTQIKQKMCLRSFRGRFVQKELQFRKKKPLRLPPKKVESEYSSEDELPLKVKKPVKVVKKPTKTAEVTYRITRSNKVLSSKARRQQIKQRMLLTTKTTVKPRTLRSQFVKKGLKKELTTPKKPDVKRARKEEVSKKEDKKDVHKKDETKKEASKKDDTKKETVRKEETKKEAAKKDEAKKETGRKDEPLKKETARREEAIKKEEARKEEAARKETVKREEAKKKDALKKEEIKKESTRKEEQKKEQAKKDELRKKIIPKVEVKKDLKKKVLEVKTQRPSRKTKEAAALYMEILSHKLVNENKIDDDTSIDSFPELPNVKKTEQRENELKAKAERKTKTDVKKKDVQELKPNSSDPKPKSKEPEVEKRQTRNSAPKVIESDSDESFQADIIVPRKRQMTRSKAPKSVEPVKVSAGKKNKNEAFSESDEEPLSKLLPEKKDEENFKKPKRECAKRPQNYLAMLSSSSSEEYVEVEPETPNLELKDLSRRFGKGKVNMSNEQIEQWLKDSAMAGGGTIKSETDSMLKFGESIPTETSFPVASSIDTEKLKTTLLITPPEKKDEVKTAKSLDRKLIFRNKDKLELAPNRNAFSVSNESSVYAFGDDEDVMKTPFRRPSRRPSSTATSRSEDESTGNSQFRKPPTVPEPEEFNTPQPVNKKSKVVGKLPPKVPLDEFKYKVPSSPSASSSSSAKLYKRHKLRDILPIKLPEFPQGTAHLVEAPTFHPTEKDFQDPLEYIEKIRPKAEQFGICRIVPPVTFKPECKVADDMRFTAYNQYVHKMLHRWGPNFKELMAIKRYLSTQNITLTHPPWIGGMEIDLPRLYQTVQTLGGLKEVIEKKKWPKVSEMMKIPKSAQDRVTKLDDIYCKYLLPYDTLSPAEREKLFDDVETDWAKRESKSLLKAQQNIECLNEDSTDSDDESEECILKGRSMALNAFYRIARNTMSMWFKTPEPQPDEVEQEFWNHVSTKQNHICVHSGSIDSGSWGYGFAVSKTSPFARHSWNLKVLTNNSGSVLRAMGPLMGVTVPTLHVGMVFSSCCWYRDPHSLPWIEYLHTGGRKIWYGIPDSASEGFHTVLKKLVPNYCRNKGLWLPSDTVMVPPNLLVENGVPLCRIVQEPGQFIVVFPKAFTSSLSTGYVVSESVYFAPMSWLRNAPVVFNELRKSCEPSMFSLERLLLSIIGDGRSSVEVLNQIMPAIQELCDTEKRLRDRIKSLGVTATEKLDLPDDSKLKKKRKLQNEDGEYECEVCRMNLYVSMVSDSQENGLYCLEHAIEQLEQKKMTGKNCKLSFTYTYEELGELTERIQTAILNKTQKKPPSKFAGMPTLLK